MRRRKHDIELWINGKKTYAKRDKTSDHHQSSLRDPSNFYEEAASVEEERHNDVPVYSRTYSGHRFMKKSRYFGHFQLRSIVIAVFSAVAIGLCLGFIMLFIMGGGTDDQSTASNGSNGMSDQGTDNQDTEDTIGGNSERTMKPMQAFVLQGGVFSSDENAQSFEQSFRDSGFSPVIWERDGTFYLFLGVTQTKQQGSAITEAYSDHDIYVKEWNLEAATLKLDSHMFAWLEAVQSTWQQSLQKVSEKNVIDASAWQAIINDYPNQSERFLELYNVIKNGQEEMQTSDSMSQQAFLLKIWKQWEKSMLE
ncbi:hypothetical protein [Lentibacillus saliphilus]|uniref:hypothetical protein n=1 Tax=Lentibacillus saliphilus TaxID=2737028 RepID=UPI001C2FC59E|nr:hypothetical protein [Lentibacillus saliphilus]